ncbi:MULTISPECIES: sialic acid TRAP transporter substrate-binding protein SiaP [Vibrio]|uniref:DctP family TRAP transporter solute-binding subunit n=1 Tax=Vibrio tasmaniensis TaxID=212663 RepID=A0A2N7NJ77_9VIBR|nr:sialic acid TRAP transporter substrate-binding protein SiaP [Vibrio tasmaniensis]PMP14983.1 sialic acid-binding protein [Vibrio tasmaniensis]TKG34673.1 DctP family TRAP transporter solute-binding subunit [Vibrio tasmaniensis]TKG42820.1 DctP family TRAP transporter solute-binding subunit [Vibrio tasmaniensis]TKG53073.1 DctP family TRAP transporter solute-binding subunit [Vibrio tasmaniensis]TKG53457.1 DctP family TRAP transporter solute-binding subunit [Vibrio tasmaniensis]
MKAMNKITIAMLTLGFAVSTQAATTLKMGMQASVGSVEYTSAKLLADTIDEMSNGDIKLSLFPSAQLGDDRAMLQQLSLGDLDITYAEFGRMGLWIPRAEAVTLPYVAKDYEHLRRMFESDFGQGIREEMLTKFNWRALDTWYNGTRETTSNRPLESISDFKGLKLRVPNAKPNLNYAKLSGASPTPMAFSEVYLALQTNAVDGQENPLPTIKTMKFYEVQKNLAITNHIVNDQMVIISETTWQKLSEADRKIVTAAVAKAGAVHTASVKKQEAELVAFFESQGVNVTYPDLAPFRQAMEPLYTKFEDKIGQPIVKKLASM